MDLFCIFQLSVQDWLRDICGILRAFVINVVLSWCNGNWYLGFGYCGPINYMTISLQMSASTRGVVRYSGHWRGHNDPKLDINSYYFKQWPNEKFRRLSVSNIQQFDISFLIWWCREDVYEIWQYKLRTCTMKWAIWEEIDCKILSSIYKT